MCLLWTILVLSPAHAASTRDHQHITREAFHDVGWTDDELIEQIVRCNLATDMARLRTVYCRTLCFFYPKTGRFVDPVLGLASTARFNSHGTDGFHFNNLYSFDVIERHWSGLAEWVEANARSISESPGAFSTPTEDPRVLALYGMTTHAVQDFYSHSNWVEMLSPFLAGEAPDGFPVWEDLMDENSVWLRLHPDFDRNGALARMQLSNEFTSQDPRTGGLQTGKGRGAPPWDGDPPWEHRHAEGGIDEVIDVLSRRECALWIRRIQGLLDKSEVERSSSNPPLNNGVP
jgi:hypothetical protein